MASDDECYDYEYDVDGDGEEDWMEADEGELFEEYTSPPEQPVDCWAITKDSLSAEQQPDLSMVMNLLDVKQHHARALLIHHRWKMSRIEDHLVEKGRDRTLREAGVVVQEDNGMAAAGSTTPSGSVACNVCFEDFSLSGAVLTMECGHSFCNDCWTKYFFASLDSGKKQIRCMGLKCPAICDEAVVQYLLGRKYPRAAKRLDRILFQSYVEDNDSVKWCPSVPHCGRAIRVDAGAGTAGDGHCEVQCPCGVSFCFSCAAKPHSPCPCAMWEMWDVKCHGESENINWILAHTKSCPNCFHPISKDGGCNLVTCRCGQYLCWLCGSATGHAHDINSIVGHSCNRFVAEGKQKVEDAKRQLHRFTHYYDRFRIHSDSYKAEQQTLGRAVEAQVKVLEVDAERWEIRDAGWMTDAHRGLLRSRQVLSASYVFGYYMFGGEVRTYPAVEREKNLVIAQNLFEDHQEQLERHAERLSKLLATAVTTLPEEILRAKQEAFSLAKVVETHCGEIYKCIQDELLPLLVDRVNIAAYRPAGPDKAKEFPL